MPKQRKHKLTLQHVITRTVEITAPGSPDLPTYVAMAQNLGWTVVELDGEPVEDVCEGCSMPLVNGPGLHLDADSVPLCDDCWDSLCAEAKEAKDD